MKNFFFNGACTCDVNDNLSQRSNWPKCGPKSKFWNWLNSKLSRLFKFLHSSMADLLHLHLTITITYYQPCMVVRPIFSVHACSDLLVSIAQHFESYYSRIFLPVLFWLLITLKKLNPMHNKLSLLFNLKISCRNERKI